MIKIHDDFEQMIAPLSPDEYKLLAESILKDGCLDALRLWRGWLVDGHHRYEICTRHGIPFHTVELDLDSFDDVKAWILSNQLGRRNLTDQQRTYYIGALLELEETTHGGSRYQNDTLNLNGGRARERVADFIGQSEATAVRAKKYKQAVDLIADQSEELKASILAGELKISKSETIQFGAVAKKKPELATRAIDEMIAGNARSLRHGLALAGYSNEDASRSITINISSVERVALSLKRHMKSDEIERLIQLLGE
jgi:hypothetical protein